MVKALESIFGGEPTLNSYNGEGNYDAFPSYGGGGGGGGYIPPVAPNPIYIPPTYSNEIINNSIRVNLIVEDGGEVEFLENGSSKGYGVNTTIAYSPSTTFNGSKKYEVVKSGQKASKYYEVSIKKTYQSDINNNEQDAPSSPLAPVRRGFFGRLRDRLDVQPVRNTLFGGLFGKSKKFKVTGPKLNVFILLAVYVPSDCKSNSCTESISE